MQGTGRVHRVVMLYEQENLRNAIRDFSAALGITHFEGPFQIADLGLTVAVSWDAGLELIAPFGEGHFSDALRDILKSKGEGFFTLVYQVDDLDQAETRAQTHGYSRIGDYIDGLQVNGQWRNRFTMLKEAIIAPIAGVAVTLIQAEP